jgi:hypothetical protein
MYFRTGCEITTPGGRSHMDETHDGCEIATPSVSAQNDVSLGGGHLADHDGFRIESDAASDHPSHNSCRVIECVTVSIDEIYSRIGAGSEGAVNLEGP